MSADVAKVRRTFSRVVLAALASQVSGDAIDSGNPHVGGSGNVPKQQARLILAAGASVQGARITSASILLIDGTNSRNRNNA